MSSVKAKRSSVKRQALELVRSLPASASWDELMYRIYVRQKIDTGLADIETGKVHSHESVKRQFGLA
jgi:predicted transcriptional regulator